LEETTREESMKKGIVLMTMAALLWTGPAAAADCSSEDFVAACIAIKAVYQEHNRTCYVGTRLPTFAMTRSGEVSRTQHRVFHRAVFPVFKEFYGAWGSCFEEDKADGCALKKYELRECYTRAVKDLPRMITSNRARLEDEVASRDKSITEKVAKEDWAMARMVLGLVVNQLEFHKENTPDDAFIEENLAQLRAQDVELGMKEAAALEKVTCPKGKNPAPKLAGRLAGVLDAWFEDMGITEKVLILRMNGAATKKTDALGVQWEFIETIGCIEKTADHLKADPTRCRIYTTTFKRSRPAGGAWSDWTWDGFLGDKPKILCEKVK
jgi:hypothetical protein